MNFVKFLGMVFSRTPPSKHLSHDVIVFLFFFFFIISDQCGLQPKINLFGGAMVNYEKEFTSPLSLV